MNAAKLKEILDKHLHWIREDCDGWENMRADLSRANLSHADLYGANLYGADLSHANLYGANLSHANLSGANLSHANLYGADLYGANLSGADLSHADLSRANLSHANLSHANLSRANLSHANLSHANLSHANLSGADLYGANLSHANLSGADLYGANLSGADLSHADLSHAKIELELVNRFFQICCPEYGAFVAWKKANSHIVKLLIPEDAKRSSAFGRKCRASKAMCLAVENVDGTDSGMTMISSDHDPSFIYRVGETVEVADFDDDRTHECAPGIHFFITRQEAVNY